MLKGGIRVCNFSHPELSDSEEGKDNYKHGVGNQNSRFNPVAIRGRRAVSSFLGALCQEKFGGPYKRLTILAALKKNNLGTNKNNSFMINR